MHKVLKKPLSDPVPVPEKAYKEIDQVLKTGRLFRYGEDTSEQSAAARLESGFANYIGSNYAIAVNSCGSAMFLALICSGVKPQDPVLFNAFTLSPVPSAITHAGAIPVPVESTVNCTIDLQDLVVKAKQSKACFLLLSHMRGHIANMDEIVGLCKKLNICLIEDCAHTMGAKWNNKPTGKFGKAGCFSLQTFKHINAGEGGLIVTNDKIVAAKAILFSGSYSMFRQHGTLPEESLLQDFEQTTPNFSMRIGNIAAILAYHQIEQLSERTTQWNVRYEWLENGLNSIGNIMVPQRHENEQYVGSSIQFFLKNMQYYQINTFLKYCDAHGVHIKWFGHDRPCGFTAHIDHWRYIPSKYAVPKTLSLLKSLCDIRIPLSITKEESHTIIDIIQDGLCTACK